MIGGRRRLGGQVLHCDIPVDLLVTLFTELRDRKT